jgi:predicted Zn-dependent protease
MDHNHLAEAMGLLKAYQQACPENAEVYYLFAQAYEKSGQKQLALESYKRTLAIEPDFSKAADKLKALESNPASAK